MEHRHSRTVLLSVIALICVLVGGPDAVAAAGVPAVIHTSGVLRASAGGPVADGAYTLTMRLYPVQTDGAPLWSETHANVPVIGGFFAVVLGPQDPASPLAASMFAGKTAVWFGVQVGNEPELPRQRIASVPYAMIAGETATLACSGCIEAGHIATGAITQDKVAFTYAGSASKGGPATSALVADTAVTADTATLAAAAKELACTGCIDSLHIAKGSIGAPALGVDWALSDSKGGPALTAHKADLATLATEASHALSADTAKALDCVGCVAADHLANDLSLAGVTTLAGGMAAGGLIDFASQPTKGLRVELAAKAPVVCDEAHAGYLYFDTTTQAQTICNGLDFLGLSFAKLGSAGKPATSCKAILDAGDAGGTGTYWLDVDAGGPMAAFQAWCDMVTDGGGWTRFNWITKGFPAGEDPLGVELPSCGVADAVCRARIPAVVTPKDLMVRDTTQNQHALWHFDAGNEISNGVLGALRDKKAVCLPQKVAWTPYSHTSSETFCGSGCEGGCDSFFYGNANCAGIGGWGMELDGDTGWGCAAFKLGASNGVNPDWAFLDQSGQKDEQGELYYR